uniref:Uncharacterized protein n=1 Tax=Oryza sativa subsp. japonica TaxID=39947 RepID=Q69SG9_ORYSJ|nr:hypothetical protein [Oryza sativa Japonica Group]BAD46036.1 hypothetical protein [Oryza sativa Japonica Group]
MALQVEVEEGDGVARDDGAAKVSEASMAAAATADSTSIEEEEEQKEDNGAEDGADNIHAAGAGDGTTIRRESRGTGAAGENHGFHNAAMRPTPMPLPAVVATLRTTGPIRRC